MILIRDLWYTKLTLGRLSSIYIERELYTLEHAWAPDENHLGGTNFISCIPNGEYTLHHHTRPSGQEAILLENTALGVNKYEGKGRTLILIHPGNTLSDIQGCIAPGLERSSSSVRDSRAAFSYILGAFNQGDARLYIRSADTKEITFKIGG